MSGVPGDLAAPPRPVVVAILGPTATGKSALALAVAVVRLRAAAPTFAAAAKKRGQR